MPRPKHFHITARKTTRITPPTAVRTFPPRVNETFATKSGIELAHAKNVSPTTVPSMFQKTPSAVSSDTISVAIVNTHTTQVKNVT